MKCVKCHKEIDDDSKYCPYCGAEVLTRKEKQRKKLFYTNEYEDNINSDKCRNFFFIGFFIFDLIISSIIGIMNIPNIWVYVISSILYIISIIYGLKGIGYALNLKKNGKRASGLVSCILIGSTSLIIMIVNLVSVYQLF